MFQGRDLSLSSGKKFRLASELSSEDSITTLSDSDLRDIQHHSNGTKVLFFVDCGHL